MNPSGLSSSGYSRPPSCESVKALHSRREELKQRLHEKHMQRRGELRRDILDAARNSGGRASDLEEEMNYGPTPERVEHVAQPQSQPPPLNPGVTTSGAVGGVGPDMVLFGGSEWSEFGHEYRVDVSEPAVMEYLLQLEQEIRQEQLVAMYEQAHNCAVNGELEEYYNYLMSS